MRAFLQSSPQDGRHPRYCRTVLIGSPNTVLIVIRGNSGSGKSTVARTVRETYDQRGMALIGQDVVRREILRERDKADGVNIGLLDVMCQRTQFSFDDMRRWYLEQDVLPGATETIIDESSTLARTVGLILQNAGLVTGEATRL
ncbi:AAA family ATPase [Nonomuraea sp. NPDC050227]|uniref:AAA family ATPase n=1 Tax=Nonomuraea sp. NPDC050227 TaxID=3364360 RepID=UPI0037B97210